MRGQSEEGNGIQISIVEGDADQITSVVTLDILKLIRKLIKNTRAVTYSRNSNTKASQGWVIPLQRDVTSLIPRTHTHSRFLRSIVLYSYLVTCTNQ